MTRPQKKRQDDVRLIVMSATLEASKFIDYFPGCKGALIHGRAHPVQLNYTARPQDSYLDAAVNATLQVRCLWPFFAWLHPLCAAEVHSAASGNKMPFVFFSS